MSCRNLYRLLKLKVPFYPFSVLKIVKINRTKNSSACLTRVVYSSIEVFHSMEAAINSNDCIEKLSSTIYANLTWCRMYDLLTLLDIILHSYYIYMFLRYSTDLLRFF